MGSPKRHAELQEVVDRVSTGKRVGPVFDEAPAEKKRRVSVPSPSKHVHFDSSANTTCVASRIRQIRHSAASPRTKESIAHIGNGRVSVTSAAWKTKLFHGLYAAVVTPLTHDGQIAPEAIDAYAASLRADGVNGVFVTGTAGMSMSLSVPERKRLVESWTKAGEKYSLEVLAHIGAQSLEDSKELARHAEEAGVVAISAMAPAFFKPASVKELAAYMQEVAACAPSTPFLYYHFPEITGVNISMKCAMEEMHSLVPTLRGGKFTSKDMWDLGDTFDLGKRLGVEWDLMMGYEGQTTSALPLGVTAHIGIAFSVVAPVWNRMIRATEAGKLDEANTEQRIGRAWFKLFADISGLWSMTAVTKLMLEDRIGVDFGSMRIPQKGLTHEEYNSVSSAWSAFKREHPTLFEHAGLLLPAHAQISVPPPSLAETAPELPGVKGNLREEILVRCAAVAESLGTSKDEVLSLFPHLIGAHQAPTRLIKDVRQAVDHTILKADASAKDVEKLCSEAITHNFYAVCVNSHRVAQCAKRLAGTGVGLAAVVGFPLGAMVTPAKAFEAAEAVKQGATEIDMVLNVGALKEGDLQTVYDDIVEVVRASGSAKVKVIFETCLLNMTQVIDASVITVLANAAYVKTSTGFSTGGATLPVVDAMKATVGDACLVKASGGVRDAATADKYLALGVSRIGTSSGIAIVSGKTGNGY